MSRWNLRTMLIVVAIIAGPLALYAPELRTLDRNAILLFEISGLILIYFVVSFTPLWLTWRRYRKLRREGPTNPSRDAAIFCVSFLLSIAILYLAAFVIFGVVLWLRG